MLIEEPYVNKSYELENNYLELTLKPDEFFVMGDNRNVSEYSRAFGPLSKTEIKSVVKQVFKTSIIKNIF
ncbi:S26 family signal peptidase [Peptoniphilus asaccharolyticus]